MTTDPQIHHYTVTIRPTPAQAKQLQHLGWAARLTRDLAHEQALRAAHGEDIALAGVLHDAWDHPDRSVPGEAAALRAVGGTRGAPQGLLEYAVAAGRRDAAEGQARPDLDAPAPVAGDGLLRPASATGTLIAGVDGIINTDVLALPHWAATVWLTTLGLAAPPPLVNVSGAAITGSAYLERETLGGRWVLDMALRWDRYETRLLVPRWEDGALSPEREAVAHLMGWR
ncbi:hypothetical protein [Deinococcus yunweiensis]|uniref:hypothetical protein n=1 Tax=Deinococcus yunweiensis TaxID=367282 RepID=UPI00398F4C86